MEDITDLMMINYSCLDNEPVLEITTSDLNRVSVRTLKGTEAKIIYDMLKAKEEPMKSPSQLFTLFQEAFPNRYQASTYYPHGQNSIRIKLSTPIIIDDGHYIFTYNNEKEWSLETLINYNKNIKQKGAK